MTRSATARALRPVPPSDPWSAGASPLASGQSAALESAARLPLLAALCLGSSTEDGIAPQDWPPLLCLAVRQGVAPLLHLRLRGQSGPEDVRAELARLYRSNTARNLLLDRECRAAVAALGERAVVAIPLKGPQLAQLLYGDIGARQVADLDLLLRPEELPVADQALARLGYQRATTAPVEQWQKCRDVLYAREQPGGSRLFLDLHLRLRPYGRGDALAGRIRREGLTRENLLLYLCLNLLTHRWARLQPWLDLAAFLRGEGARMNWVQVEDVARGLEWPAGVFFSLRGGGQLAQTRVPDRLLRALHPGRLDAWWLESLLGGNARTTLARCAQLDGPRGALAILGCERGPAQKLRLAASILFPPAASLRQMDAAGANLPLPAHYAARVVSKTGSLFRRPGG